MLRNSSLVNVKSLIWNKIFSKRIIKFEKIMFLKKARKFP